jgi:hypothetical protein
MYCQKSSERPALVFRLFAISLIFLLGLKVIAVGAIGKTEKRSRPRLAQRDLGTFPPSELLALNIPVPRDRAAQFDAKTYYAKNCQKCHGADGAGTDGRKTFSEIPDFTSKAWHMKKTDADLEVSIQDGKGAGMPPFSEKLNEEEVKNLRKIVREFSAER